jgi:ABC-type uncharacterized transport system involved in gliding motility auxiliary subunit
MSDKKKDISKTLFSVGGFFLVFLIVILVNVIFSQFNFRWDATKEKLYSLSDATEVILTGIKDNVTIKLFYSQSVDNLPPQIKIFGPRLIDFLREYEKNSGGKIKVEIYNPKVDSEEEEWAQQYGVRGIEIPEGDTVYFGLVVIAADREETIEFMDPTREQHLEYDITRAISKVQTPKRPKIGLLSGAQIFGNPPSPFPVPGEPPEMPPWYFVEELRKNYDVAELSMAAKELEADLDLLILIYPKSLSDSLLYAVDQYVLKGGRLIVFADPFAMSAGGPDFEKFTSMDPLFETWGIKMDSEKVLVDFGHATQFMDKDNQVIENPIWLSMDRESFNPEHPVTARLESMLFSITGVIEKRKGSDVQYTWLIRSSPKSQLINRFQVRQKPEAFRRAFKPSGIRYDVAVALNGTFKTSFPGGPPSQPSQPGAERTDTAAGSQKPHLAQGVKSASIIVIADVDVIHDNNYVEHQTFLGQEVSQVYNDNLNFLLNACELMAGNKELINIRTRGKFEKPFEKIAALEKKAQEHWMAQEQELVKKFDETNGKLKSLEKQKNASQEFVFSAEQEEEIKKFKEEKQRINKKLKEVRRNLRSEIEKLGIFIKFINIFLMPILVSIAGIGYAVVRRNRAQKARERV